MHLNSCICFFSTTHKLFNSPYVHWSLKHWHMFTDAMFKRLSNRSEMQASRPLACCGILMVAGGVIVCSFPHGSHLQFLGSGVLGGKWIISRQCSMLIYRDVNKSQRSRFCHERYQGRTTVGEGYRNANPPPPPQNPQKSKYKKHRFYMHNGIKRFTWFTLQTRSVTEIGWWVMVHTIKEKPRNMATVIELCNM